MRKDLLLLGENIVLGEKYHQCFYRSELYRLLGGLKHVAALYVEYGIKEWNLELKCNGLETINKAERYDYPPSTSVAHFDIISFLHTEINCYLGRISFSHVKGYWDKGSSILNLYKQLNGKCENH